MFVAFDVQFVCAFGGPYFTRNGNGLKDGDVKIDRDDQSADDFER
jgi:hypothetical protein